MVKGGCSSAEKLRSIKKEEEEKGNLIIVLQIFLNWMIRKKQISSDSKC